PPVRGPRPALRGGRAVGVPVRLRAAADRRRDRVAGQPDRGPLVLLLRVFGSAPSLTEVGQGLESGGVARNAALAPGVQPGRAVLTAEVQPWAADAVLRLLANRGV